MRASKTILASAIASATMLTAGIAQADPVTQLWFSQQSVFDTAGADPTGLVLFDTAGGRLIFDGFNGDSTGFGWYGDRTGDTSVSSIQLNDFNTDAAGNMFTDAALATADADGEWNEGDWWQISSVDQTNNILGLTGGTFPDPLWIADALGALRIFDQADITDGLEVNLDESVDQISFFETLNASNGCPAGTNPLGTVCDDIYGVAATSFAPVSFDLDGYTYEVNFQLAAGPATPGPESLICTGQNLIDAVAGDPCTELSASLTQRLVDGELLVFTAEAAPGMSSIEVYAAWTATKIPVPATLGLMGLGLLGLGLRNRKG